MPVKRSDHAARVHAFCRACGWLVPVDTSTPEGALALAEAHTAELIAGEHHNTEVLEQTNHVITWEGA